MPKVWLSFSASKINTLQVCKAKYDMSVNKNKTVPIHEKSSSLDFGVLAHIGLEVYFNDLKNGIHYNDRMQNTLMKIREAACNPDKSNANSDDVDIISAAVEQSCDYWRAEDENQLEVLAVESPFDYILHEDEDIGIIISGKIDLLVNTRGIGNQSSYQNLPFDHKTNKREFPTDRLDNQFENYCVAVNSNYLIVNKIGLQKTLKAEEKFKRIPLSYDPLILQQWKDNTITVILQEYLACVASGKWPMNTTACRKFGRLCEFYQVCDASGIESKNWKLEANYVESEKWDKYNVQEEIN